MLRIAKALATPFVPESFTVPERVETEGFVLVPLGPGLRRGGAALGRRSVAF